MPRFAATAIEMTNPLIETTKNALDAQDALAACPRNRLNANKNVIRLPDLAALRNEVAHLSAAISAGVNCGTAMAIAAEEGATPDCIDVELFNDSGRSLAKLMNEVKGLLGQCGIGEVSEMFSSGRQLTAQFKVLGKMRRAALHADPKQWLRA